MLTEAVPGQAVALTIELERVYPGSSLEDHVSPVDEQPHLSPKVAHRDRSPFSGRPRYRGIADMAGPAAGWTRSKVTLSDISNGKLLPCNLTPEPHFAGRKTLL
jgi:hypothetical protein